MIGAARQFKTEVSFKLGSGVEYGRATHQLGKEVLS